MADEIIKIKVSQLPMATVLDNLEILGVDKSTNKSVRAAMSLLRGLDGKPVELRESETHVQWRVSGGTWANLVALADLQGPPGRAFVYSDFTTAQLNALKVKGDPGPANSLAIGTVQSGATPGATITGAAPNQTLNLTLQKGDTPVKGIDYFDGNTPQKGVDYFDGADGKNAVMTIGTITTVASNARANATIEPDGVDAEGKPKFKLNLWLPKGVDGEGAGDMLKSVYDTKNKAVDVFEYVDGKVGDMGAYKWQYNELTDSLDLIKTI